MFSKGGVEFLTQTFLTNTFCAHHYFALILSLVTFSPVIAAPNPAVIKKSYQYDSLIIKHALKAGIPVALVYAVMHQESGFDRKIVSHAGAQGLMQLMPATARRFGVKNAFDADENIRAGTSYLAWLLKRFKGNLKYALAGYNAGEGKVDKYKGIPPYKETRNYVKKVMGYYRHYAGLGGNQKTPGILANKHNNKPVIQWATRQHSKHRNLAIKAARLKKQLLLSKSIQLAKARKKQQTIRPKHRKPANRIIAKTFARTATKHPAPTGNSTTRYESSSRVHSMTIAMNNPQAGYTRIRARAVR